MIRLLSSLLMVMLVTACGHTSVPAYGKLADKDKTFLQGDWSNGVLTLRNVDGLSCSGDYMNDMFSPLTTDVFLHCSDGRTGSLLLTRNSSEDQNLFNLETKKTAKKKSKNVAYGQGRLSDGTKFEVYLGQMSGLMKSPSLVK